MPAMHIHGLKLWDRIFGWKRRAEARATLRHVEPFLTPGSSVLDVGCGIGYVLDVLNNEFQCTGYGCDVVKPPVDIERFAKFDGVRLPYRDKSFDVAFLIFVLHHADDPGLLLREASRVARRSVVVLEDTPEQGFERRWGKVHIQSFAARHSIPWEGRVRSDEEWRQIFQFSGMPIQYAEKLGRFERLPPVTRTAFALQPAPLPAVAQEAVARAATS